MFMTADDNRLMSTFGSVFMSAMYALHERARIQRGEVSRC